MSGAGGRRVLNFGVAARPMVGMLHVPPRPDAGGPAVLLCNPLGHEAVRAHRVLAVLANRLARAGAHALRFDYHASGDSAGDDLDGELDGWSDDVVAADAELRAQARPGRVVWVGLRLGAALVARASTRVAAPPDAVVLWEPVLDGAEYLRSLAIADRTAVSDGFSIDVERYRRLSSAALPETPTELLGLEVSATLLAQLRALGPSTTAAVRSTRVTIATSRADAATAAVADAIRAAGGDATIAPLRDAVDWATNDASGQTIVPTEIIDLIVPMATGAAR